MRTANEPWEASFPEEGDTIDKSVFVCNHDTDGYEVIELTGGSLKDMIPAAKMIAKLLNIHGGKLTS